MLGFLFRKKNHSGFIWTFFGPEKFWVQILFWKQWIIGFSLTETGFFAPDLLDYFYSMKDGFLNDISEDKDTCIQRLFCEFLSHEDPYVQNMASKW